MCQIGWGNLFLQLENDIHKKCHFFVKISLNQILPPPSRLVLLQPLPPLPLLPPPLRLVRRLRGGGAQGTSLLRRPQQGLHVQVPGAPPKREWGKN